MTTDMVSMNQKENKTHYNTTSISSFFVYYNHRISKQFKKDTLDMNKKLL